MKYVTVPKEIKSTEILKNDALFSPGRYVRFIAPSTTTNAQFVPLNKLLVLREERTIVKKKEPYLYAEIGDINVATGSVTFQPLLGYQVPNDRPAVAKTGDVLISTVRTYRKGIGYVWDDADKLVTTNALMNVCGVTDFVPDLTLLYVYSFLRTDFFTEQVWSMLNRGMYPRMDKGALKNILLPIPQERIVFRYVSALQQAIIDKAMLIRERSDTIHASIQEELEHNQKQAVFQFEYPNLQDIKRLGRFDAAIYDKEYKSKVWLIENYSNGFTTPEADGFKVTPGPSLEIKILRTRLDSDTYKPGFYALILPMNISEYGTMNVISYLGTAKKLPLLRQGDIVFGEAGFHKGRSIVLLDGIENCTTNAHGLYARRLDGNTQKSIFFRCIFNWYRSMRLIDLMAVGGSGGHFSPEYFNYLRIPKFPDDKQEAIALLYHNPNPTPNDALTLDTFVDWHRSWNANLGIWELDREMKVLQKTLAEVQEKIIQGQAVSLPV